MVLRAEGLNVHIPTVHGALWPVRNVDLSIAPGETLGIVGESGCGKSLTSLALMGLLPVRARRHADVLEIAGNDLLQLEEKQMSNLRGDTVAMIFQDPMTSLNPAYTVGEQLTEVLRRHTGASRRQALGRAAELLDRVGIDASRQRLAMYPYELSGGLRQRVMIAMALMCEPQLLIADEPTTALDVTIQLQILDLLVSLQEEFGMALLIITHDFGVVARIANNVAVMYAGEVVEHGPVGRVLSDPLHPYTRGLLSCIPVSGVHTRGRLLPTIPGQVSPVFRGADGCGFRNRCNRVFDACESGEVPTRFMGDGRSVRCLLYEVAQGAAS